MKLRNKHNLIFLITSVACIAGLFRNDLAMFWSSLSVMGVYKLRDIYFE